MASYSERYRDTYVPFEAITWNIGREGRAWEDEALDMFMAMPEKIEMNDGKLFWSEDDRLKILCSLLEHVGIDRVIRFGDPALWREAIAELPA